MKKTNGVYFGRSKRDEKTKPETYRTAENIPESLLFIFGMAFILFSLIGLLGAGGGDSIDYQDDKGAVAVFSETERISSESEDGGIWNHIEEVIKEVISK